jgi:hypothetical protein
MPASEINCRHQDINIKTGQARDSRILWFVQIFQRIKDTPISLALQGDVVNVSNIESWHRVNTFSSRFHRSPHYAFHSAFEQASELTLILETHDASELQRKNAANGLLAAWQRAGNSSKARAYLRALDQQLEDEATYPIPLDHDTLLRESTLVASAEDLTETVISPHLECQLPANMNVLWCSTFQVAWNELCELSGSPVRLFPDVQDANILSKKNISKQVLDPTSYVAVAGFGSEAIERIKGELQTKFGGAARPNYLPEPISEGTFIAYAYLFQLLPFEYAFTRLGSLEFGNRRVASFGIKQYIPSHRNEFQMAKQILVYDYRDETDFIVELIPKNPNHRIILAQVPPLGTLSKTIEDVQLRISSNTPSGMMGLADLVVPIIDFDIYNSYSQLEGHSIKAQNPQLDGQMVAKAFQSIRFRLDEKGAVLKSEAGMVGAKERNLIFKNPFLVLLQKHDSSHPYLALWIANAELLTPFGK